MDRPIWTITAGRLADLTDGVRRAWGTARGPAQPSRDLLRSLRILIHRADIRVRG